MKKFLSLISFTILILSCNDDWSNQTNRNGDSDIAVEILSTVNGQPFIPKTGGYTKVYGANWSTGDQIGVYMINSGSTLSSQSVLAGNKRYVTTAGDGFFKSYDETETIYFPESGKVDFISYYPYKTSLNNFIYPIDVSDQSSQTDIDFLYSTNTSGLDINSPNVAMSFSHQLTKLVLNITVKTNIPSLTGFNAIINDVATKADFSLVNGELTANNSSIAPIEMFSTLGTKNVIAEAILIPANMNGKKIVFTLPSGTKYTWTLENVAWTKGNKYTYNITLNDGGGDITPDYGWTELPDMTDAPANTVFVSHSLPEAQYSHIRNFSMLYDTDNKVAYWVAYPMCPFYRDENNSNRTNQWGYDPRVEQQHQPNLSSAWPEASTRKFDRGHQLPSADRNYSKTANATTFYYTNMTAQNSTLNQAMWATLETKVRSWMYSCDTIYVVTGAMITTKTDNTIDYTTDNSGKSIAVPKYYYKALAKLNNGQYNTIAFKMNNEAIYTNEGYLNFSMSVTELEEETGFTFFPSLNNDVKNTVNKNLWQ